MTEYLLLGAMATLILLQLVLRTHTAIAFLALCGGSVLLAASGDNASLVASSLTSGASASANIARIALLIVPFMVSVFLLRKHLQAALLPLGFIPAVCAALLAGLYVTPELPDSIEAQLVTSETWKLLFQYQEPVVGIGLVVSLVLIGITIKRPHDLHHHKKGKH